MGGIYIDPDFDEDRLRSEIFDGELVVLTRLSAVAELVDHTRAELEKLFGGEDPESAHQRLSPAEMASVLGAWKPQFMRGPADRLVRQIFEQAGFPPEATHYDLPKIRTSMPKGHLNTGVAFAFPWHRDAWYSAPAAQINWWLPIYPVRSDNAMAFDRSSFGRAVPNDSRGFDYYAINAARYHTAEQVGREVQARPGAIDHVAGEEEIVLPAPGSVLLFSGAQLHTSIPNTSGRARYSIDFRTVDARDVAARRGAPLVDCECTGTSIRDFLNAQHGGAFDEGLVRSIYGEPPAGAVLRFEPTNA